MSYVKATAFLAVVLTVGGSVLSGYLLVGVLLANHVGDWAGFTWLFGILFALTIIAIAEEFE